MRAIFSVCSLFIIASLLAGCASQRQLQPLHQSAQYYDYIQPSFAEYLEVSHQWLRLNRGFITKDIDKELAMNGPYQLKPKQTTDKAILLVHGLGDSPYSFSDLSQSLVKLGFHVQVLLLPGHGSKPEDLMLPSYLDWQQIVDHYAGLLKQEYGQVWLGGFSTGANLVTINAIQQQDVEGLLLFSAGFQSQAPYLEKLTPLLASFREWGWRGRETNLAKYTPLNGAVAYTQSASRLRDLIKQRGLSIPTLMIQSELDSVIDANAVKGLFLEHISHPKSKMLWYGEAKQVEKAVEQYSMVLPDKRVSTGSHMGVLFSPTNSYYGFSGEKRVCQNGLEEEQRLYCENGGDVWYSAWGIQRQGKIHARLTWNPYYAELEQEIASITEAD